MSESIEKLKDDRDMLRRAASEVLKAFTGPLELAALYGPDFQPMSEDEALTILAEAFDKTKPSHR